MALVDELFERQFLRLFVAEDVSEHLKSQDEALCIFLRDLLLSLLLSCRDCKLLGVLHLFVLLLLLLYLQLIGCLTRRLGQEDLQGFQ